jgi:hypothetical protein
VILTAARRAGQESKTLNPGHAKQALRRVQVLRAALF